jgi:signal transduction histidine kinase
MRITFSHDNVPASVSPDVSLCLYRVAQEALANALKHSQATQVNLHLSGRGDWLSLDIVDDGIGFDVTATRGQGLGLISMSERLDALGASLDIRSACKGTCFTSLCRTRRQRQRHIEYGRAARAPADDAPSPMRSVRCWRECTVVDAHSTGGH